MSSKEISPYSIIDTMVKEHEIILGYLEDLERINRNIQKTESYSNEEGEFDRLKHIAEHLIAAEPHHQREEQGLFPEIEKRGLTGPPSVMRMEHDILRRYKHQLKDMLEKSGEMDFHELKQQLKNATTNIVPTLREHIAKENNILYPMAKQAISDFEVWERMKQECDKIGYCCLTPDN